MSKEISNMRYNQLITKAFNETAHDCELIEKIGEIAIDFPLTQKQIEKLTYLVREVDCGNVSAIERYYL